MSLKTMGKSGASVLFLCALLLQCWTGFCGQFHIRTASTDGSSDVRCSPSHIMLIRTAHYLPMKKTRTNSSRNRRDDIMTSEDVMRLYRYCETSDVAQCDVSKAGVKKNFAISYFCLEEPFVNPCSIMTLEEPQSQISFLVDYSEHVLANNVSCQCTLTTETHESTPAPALYIHALNFYDKTKGGQGRQDDEVLRNNASERGAGPLVMIETQGMRWEVEHQPTPVQWQITKGRNTSVTLLFDRLQSVSFGHVWIDLIGVNANFSSYCNFTSQPGIQETTESTYISSPTPAASSHEEEKQSDILMLMTWVVIAAVGGMVCFVVIPTLIVTERHRSSRSKNQHSSPPPFPHDNACLSNLEGEYCTISEISLSRLATATDSRNLGQNTETTAFGTSSVPSTETAHRDNNNKRKNSQNRNRDKKNKGNNSHDEQAGSSAAIVSTPQSATLGVPDSIAEYGSLNHGSVLCVTSATSPDSAIYDHIPGRQFAEGDYQHLHHVMRVEPRVIDNIYDHATNVCKPAPPIERDGGEDGVGGGISR